MAENLPKATIAEYKAAFALFDKNKDGYLNSKEVASLLQSEKLDENIPYEVIQRIVREVDAKGKGRVNITQFIDLMARFRPGSHQMQDVLEAFQVFDQNGDGVISVSELRQVMLNLGERLTDQELQKMFREADLDGDGQINYNEFLKMMKLG